MKNAGTIPPDAQCRQLIRGDATDAGCAVMAQKYPRRDTFTAEKFVWLGKVARDPVLPDMAARVAIVLSGYFNRATGEAWPSLARLAGELHADARNLRRVLRTMETRGHLSTTKGGGRAATSRYRLIVQTNEKGGLHSPGNGEEMGALEPGFTEPETGANDAEKGGRNCKKGGLHSPGIPLNNPSKKPLRVRARAKQPHLYDFREHSPGVFEAVWKEQALSSEAGHHELEKFRAYYTARGTRFVSWPDAFKKWLLDAKQPTQNENEPPAAPPRIRVDRNSPQGQAWVNYGKQHRPRGYPWVNGFWYFPSEWPPEDAKE